MLLLQAMLFAGKKHHLYISPMKAAKKSAPSLTPEQKADAARLMAAYRNWKADKKAAGETANQETMAHELGMTQSAFSQFCRGVRPINVELLTKLRLVFGWKPEDISPSLAMKMAKVAEATGAIDPDSHAPVRMIDAKASAGRGQVVCSDDVTKELMFRRDWLSKKGAKPDKVLAFTVDGVSMIDAHIPDGAVVLANTSRQEPISGKFFVLWIDGELFVKELVRTGEGWIARSHNTAEADRYPDIEIEIDHRIVGQVFWCGFEM